MENIHILMLPSAFTELVHGEEVDLCECNAANIAPQSDKGELGPKTILEKHYFYDICSLEISLVAVLETRLAWAQ